MEHRGTPEHREHRRNTSSREHPEQGKDRGPVPSGGEAHVFVGTFEHSLDDKGRVVLPSTFRSHLAERGFLSQFDNCLGLWTEEGFADVAKRLTEKIREGLAPQDAMRAFSANAAEVQARQPGSHPAPAAPAGVRRPRARRRRHRGHRPHRDLGLHAGGAPSAPGRREPHPRRDRPGDLRTLGRHGAAHTAPTPPQGPTTRRTAAPQRPGSLIRSLSAGTMEGPYSARFPSSPIGETSRRAPAGRGAADERSGCPPPPQSSGRHRAHDRTTTRAFAHRPVMVDEIVELFAPVPAGVLIDATLGGGGHARALLDAHPHLRVARPRPGRRRPGRGRRRWPTGSAAGSRSVRARFDHLADVVDAERGQHDRSSACSSTSGSARPSSTGPTAASATATTRPLDMRMDRDRAAHRRRRRQRLRRGASWPTCCAGYGDERFAGRIARAIVAARPVTHHRRAGRDRPRRHPRAGPPHAAATRPSARSRPSASRSTTSSTSCPARSTQAIDAARPRAAASPCSRYHSGEDRIVKDRLRQAETGGCTCPPGLPVRVRRGADGPPAQAGRLDARRAAEIAEQPPRRERPPARRRAARRLRSGAGMSPAQRRRGRAPRRSTRVARRPGARRGPATEDRPGPRGRAAEGPRRQLADSLDLGSQLGRIGTLAAVALFVVAVRRGRSSRR